MEIHTKNNKLMMDNLIVVFEKNIYQHLIFSEGVVVLLSSRLSVDEQEERNVYFVDLKGVIKWQIEHNSKPSELGGYQGYTDISLDEDGTLRAYSFAGMSNTIDIKTGKIITRTMAK